MGLFSKKKKEENTAVQEVQGQTDSELIAVITAAIAAYEAEQFAPALYIRKINRAAGVRPIWGTTGTNEAIDMRRI